MSNDEAFAWIQEFPGAATACDSEGIILAMNDKSMRTFQDSGGAALIGSNLFDCHPEPSRTRLKELLGAGRTNVYTIEKKGRLNNDYKKCFVIARQLRYTRWSNVYYIDGITIITPGECSNESNLDTQ